MSDGKAGGTARYRAEVSRREALALGSVIAAGATFASPFAALAKQAIASPLGLDLLTPAHLSVGFIEESEGWVQELDLPWEQPGFDPGSLELSIVPAERLTVSSELALARVEVNVHGFFPSVPDSELAAGFRTCYLFAGTDTPPEMVLGPEPLAFLAWSARMDPQARQAAKVRPVVETGVDGGLYFGLETRAGGGRLPGGSLPLPRRPGTLPPVVEGPRYRAADFTVDAIAGRPKLQEGVYLLAFGDRTWEQGWRGTMFELLQRAGGFESVAVGIRRIG